MTHVVGEACIKCKYTDCVDVCPVDAFREGKNMLVIDPDECIDCGVCIPECPVEAIHTEEDVPQSQLDYIALNAELARHWPTITKTKAALPDAQSWAKVDDKRELLDRRGQNEPGAPDGADTADAAHAADERDEAGAPRRAGAA